MDAAAYRAAKAASNERYGPRPVSPVRSFLSKESRRSLASARRTAAAPALRGVNRSAATELTSLGRPPDAHGAAGTDYYGEITNSRIDVYNTSDGSFVKHEFLETFFFYNTTDIFDPRIVKDPWTGRWIVTAIGNNEAAGGEQHLFIGISKGVSLIGDPVDEWCFYQPNINYNGSDFFDFPQLGLDQNSLIITGNVFQYQTPPTGDVLKYGEILTFPKQAMFNCESPITYLVFSGFTARLAPPIVYDSNPKSFLLAAPEQGSSLELFAGENLGDATRGSLTFQANVPVPSYVLPAGAPQCRSSLPIDPSDSRFVNASTQRGDSLWNVHTTSFEPGVTVATPRFYEVNAASNSVARSGQFWADDSSSDWNASIAVNQLGEASFTWTSNNTKPCVHPQVRFTGYQPGDVTDYLGAGAVVATSGTRYEPDPGMYIQCGNDVCVRWGDYSAVSLDPSPYPGCDAGRRAWIVNEKVYDLNTTLWSSQIARVGFC